MRLSLFCIDHVQWEALDWSTAVPRSSEQHSSWLQISHLHQGGRTVVNIGNCASQLGGRGETFDFFGAVRLSESIQENCIHVFRRLCGLAHVKHGEEQKSGRRFLETKSSYDLPWHDGSLVCSPWLCLP